MIIRKLFVFALAFGLASTAPVQSKAANDETQPEQPSIAAVSAEAEASLSQAWEELQKVASKNELEILKADQDNWIEQVRPEEVKELMALPPDKLPPLIVDNGQPNKMLAQALATTERAGKIRMLTEQMKSHSPLKLGGYLGKSRDHYTFTPYPFSVPFELCAYSSRDKLPEDVQELIEEQINGDNEQVYVTGVFVLPGVYTPYDLKIEVNTGGMAWREQDIYLDSATE